MRDVSRILLTADRSLELARHAYAETFGRPVNDPSINEEINRLLEEALGEEDEEFVKMPAELVLAILLRPGGRKRGHSPARESRRMKRANNLALRVARRLKSEGMTAEQAALAAKEQISCLISAETILDRIYPVTPPTKGKKASG